MRRKRLVRFVMPLAALSFPVALDAEAATNCGSPGPNQAIVWEHDFTGHCDVLEIGSYPFSVVNAMSVGNDNISSVSVGSNVKVTLYEHDLPGTGPGDWLPLVTSRSVLSDFNDKTSSIRVESRTSCSLPGTDQVVVWSDANFAGSCDVLDRGFPVSFAKIQGLSVGNDAISSVRCGSSSAVVLWENDLADGLLHEGANACSISVLPTLDEQVSSLVVKVPEACAPHGQCSTSDSFCELPTAGCTATAGMCMTRPTDCDGTLVPVCGCNGRTYTNDCERQAAGVPKWFDGVGSAQSCPNTIPLQGATCSQGNISCVFKVPNTDCVQRYFCTNGHWLASTAVCGF